MSAVVRHLFWDDLERDAPIEGLERQRIVGEKMMVSRIVLRAGCKVPRHAHENEQFAYVMSGRVAFELGDAGSGKIAVGAGQVLVLPSGVPHAAEALEDSVVLDLFAPPSETTGIDE